MSRGRHRSLKRYSACEISCVVEPVHVSHFETLDRRAISLTNHNSHEILRSWSALKPNLQPGEAVWANPNPRLRSRFIEQSIYRYSQKRRIHPYGFIGRAIMNIDSVD
jgi:hypothetical protein